MTICVLHFGVRLFRCTQIAVQLEVECILLCDEFCSIDHTGSFGDVCYEFGSEVDAVLKDEVQRVMHDNENVIM